MEKSTFVDFRNFLNIIFVYFGLQCLQKCENDFRVFFAKMRKRKYPCVTGVGVKLCMRESVDYTKDDIQ
jgi:hypothetical protein